MTRDPRRENAVVERWTVLAVDCMMEPLRKREENPNCAPPPPDGRADETWSTMNGLIRASLRNPIAVTVMTLTLGLLGALACFAIPIDILPVFRSPAVQALTFYGGMP